MKRTLAAALLTLLVAGCAALQPPRTEAPTIYLLDARPAALGEHVRRELVLAASSPRSRPGFDTAQIAYVRQPHELDYYAKHRWADSPAHMLAPLVAQALEQSGSFRAVVQGSNPVPADLRLDTELVRLQHDFGTQPSRVQLTLRAQLVDVGARKVLAVQVFDEFESAASEDAYGGVIAANQALARVLGQLVDFCVAESASR
jgi:cholesterol transport system auxiliary component